jgi:hypothetical protein
MALFEITVKRTSVSNGIRLEKGMNVELVSSHSHPISTNGGREVIEAFERKYGIDIKKAGGLSTVTLDVKRIK